MFYICIWVVSIKVTTTLETASLQNWLSSQHFAPDLSHQCNFISIRNWRLRPPKARQSGMCARRGAAATLAITSKTLRTRLSCASRDLASSATCVEILNLRWVDFFTLCNRMWIINLIWVGGGVEMRQQIESLSCRRHDFQWLLPQLMPHNDILPPMVVGSYICNGILKLCDVALPW